MSQPEVWLRGPLEGVDPILMPAAHALIQAAEDLKHAASDLTVQELWVTPGARRLWAFTSATSVGASTAFSPTPAANGSRNQRQALALKRARGSSR
jgi:hypothetical protein